MHKKFEILPHTADLKLRAYGKDLQQLFSNALEGMFRSINPIVAEKEIFERAIEVSSHDLESLLVDFLSEALYLSDVHGEAYFEARMGELSHTHLKGTLYGVKIEDFEEGEIKAVTHHGLKVEKGMGGWTAEMLFDL